MAIDCDDYEILARSGHPCEYTLQARDVAVGLDAANLVAKRLRDKYPGSRVEVFLREPSGARFLVITPPAAEATDGA